MAGSDLYGSEHTMKQLTEGSMFSGIMGFGEGLRQAGFRNLWAIEKEPFCQAVIRSRFPETELLTDVRDCGKRNLRAVDVLTAGFPCQDLSVAGKRAGLGGARSGLFWEVVRILGELGPAWFVLENVPGLFSSNEGRDFAVVLNALDELGYGLAWRVLNSQFFGVAQRRRRVFIVGRFGKPCPAEVLFEPTRSGWDIAESGEAWPGVADPLTSGSGVTNNAPGRRREDDYNLAVAISSYNQAEQSYRGDGSDNIVAAPITASYGKQIDSSDRNGGPPNIVQQAISSKWAKGSSGPAGDEHHNLVCATLNAGGNDGGFRTEPGEHIVIQDVRGGTRDKTDHGQGIGIREGGPSYTLGAVEQHGVAHTVTENMRNRSQGPANYVSSPVDSNGVRDFTGLPQGLDSARYRALGNAVTAKVAYWIGKRIIEAAKKEQVNG